MKTGIYTLPLNYNYGGLLQAFALQTVLERMGHDVTIIDRPYVQRVNILMHPGELLRRMRAKYLQGNHCVRIFEENYQAKVYPIIEQNTRKFVHQYIHVSKVDDASEVKEGEYDAIIVGSDQIWRAGIQKPKQRYHAFLDFTQGWNIKRIAYAPSFGTDKWEYTRNETGICKQLIGQFDAISVRESSGIQLCREYLETEAEHVLDPTLLLDKDDYLQLIPDACIHAKGKLMAYILDENDKKLSLVNRVAEEYQLTPFKVNAKSDDIQAPVEERIQPPVENWLKGFAESDYIVTDSFHACVFAVIFGKPFLVIGNKKRGMSRFESLLGMLELKDRLVDEGFTGDLPTSSISVAQNILVEKKAASLSWLKKALDE